MSDCPMNDRGIAERESKPCANGDKTCWYCGSWDRDEFMAFIARVMSGEIPKSKRIDAPTGEPFFSPTLTLSDRRHKIYVRQEGVVNALEGAIKVYTAHLTADDIALVNDALRACHDDARGPTGRSTVRHNRGIGHGTEEK